jgi:hypothetical protein
MAVCEMQVLILQAKVSSIATYVSNRSLVFSCFLLLVSARMASQNSTNASNVEAHKFVT